MSERKREPDFEKLISLATKIGRKCVSDEWTGDRTRYRFECTRGHDFFSLCPRLVRCQLAAHVHTGRLAEQFYGGGGEAGWSTAERAVYRSKKALPIAVQSRA